MSLPWERFGPDEPAEPELPYVPPPVPLPIPPSPPIDLPPQPLPEPTPPTPQPVPDSVSPDVKDLATDLLHEALDYAKTVISGTLKGQDIDIAHPTVTAITAEGKELVVADARNRSWRTLLQGLGFDLFAALVAAVAALSGTNPFQKETWILFGTLLLKSFVSAGISFFMRMRVAPTVRKDGEKLQVVPLMVPKPEKTT